MSDAPSTCSTIAPLADDGTVRAFDPAWRSETVLALAKGIVAENAYDRMPIIADALEEAGCDDEVLLRHCRECELHKPVCWVLKPILFPAQDVTQWSAKIEWHDDGRPSIYSPQFAYRFANPDLKDLNRTLLGMGWLYVAIGFLLSVLVVWVFVIR